MRTTLEPQQNKRLQSGSYPILQLGRRGWMMLAVGAAALLAAGSAKAQFALPFYEPFPSAVSVSGLAFNGYAYENNEELGQSVAEAIGGTAASSASVWTSGNSISSSCGRILETNGVSGLEYPGLTNVDAVYQTGLFAQYTKDTSSTKDRGVNLAIPTNDPSAPEAIYASLLINIQTNRNAAGTLPYPFFGLTTTTSGTSVNQNGLSIYLNSSLQLQISKNSATPIATTTAPLQVSNTYFVVIRYQYSTNGQATTNDEVDLWLNPIALGTNAVPPPTISYNDTNNVLSNYFHGIGIYVLPNPPQIFMDEIRVATNWAGVTPTFPSPGVIYDVTDSAAGGSTCGSSSITVGLSGSDVGVDYYLYLNGIEVTNNTGAAVLEGGTGAAISFGGQTVSGDYTVLGSNTVTTNVGWMSGDANLLLLVPISIAAQPLPVSVPTGSLASFTVAPAITGNGQFYQWYKGGTALTNGAEYSGVQTTNLTIYPVGAGDAATSGNGYYVVITNACGYMATSTTSALVIGSPNNLFWIGDGISNLWDVDTSANWATSDGGLPTSVFNFGDNVTLDDDTINTNLVLNSLDISPSTITVNGGLNTYLLSGPGSLAGPGSILMNSTVSLTLAVPNTETGGLVISNGVVTFTRAAYLGAGGITLAGGQLSSPNIGAVGISNVITVTGTNSAIGINSRGGQNLFITNNLVGTTGTLTLINNTTTAANPLMEFLYTNLAFNLPVDVNPGTVAGELFLTSANTSGVQSWTGLITDTGGVERDAPGGTTYINNSSNTYSGGTVLVSGNLAIGASTVYFTPGQVSSGIVSGPLGTGPLVISTNLVTGSNALVVSNGPQSLGNPINFQLDVVIPPFIIGGSQSLTLDGAIDLFGTNRTLEIDNTASTSLAGIVMDSVNDSAIALAIATAATPPAPGALTKTGNGTLYFDAIETAGFTDANLNPVVFGTITNRAGTLAGSGVIGGPVVVVSGANLAAGDAAQIGTLTITNNLTLQGTATFRISKNGTTLTSDLVTGVSNVVYGGKLVLTNVGPTALALNDSFQLFSAGGASGNFTNITGGGVFTNFTFNPATGIVSLSQIIPNTPTNISVTYSLGGSSRSVNLSWPASYQGWILQSNSVGIGSTTNWFTVPGSASATSESIPINELTTNVYYRMIQP